MAYIPCHSVPARSGVISIRCEPLTPRRKIEPGVTSGIGCHGGLDLVHPDVVVGRILIRRRVMHLYVAGAQDRCHGPSKKEETREPSHFRHAAPLLIPHQYSLSIFSLTSRQAQNKSGAARKHHRLATAASWVGPGGPRRSHRPSGPSRCGHADALHRPSGRLNPCRAGRHAA